MTKKLYTTSVPKYKTFLKNLLVSFYKIHLIFPNTLINFYQHTHIYFISFSSISIKYYVETYTNPLS